MRDVIFKIFFVVDTLAAAAVGYLLIVVIGDWSIWFFNILRIGVLLAVAAILISGIVLRRMAKPVFANIVLALLAVPILAAVIVVGAMRHWPIQRQLDQQPIASVLQSPLEPGHVEGGFGLNTCCDQGSLRPWDTGLVIWVRFNSTELRQTIASCYDAGTGNAISSLTGIEMATASCDGELFYMILENNAIIVQKGNVRKRDNIVSIIPLPEGTAWTDGRASLPRPTSKPIEDLCQSEKAPTFILENGSVKYCSEKPEISPFWDQFIHEYTNQ